MVGRSSRRSSCVRARSCGMRSSSRAWRAACKRRWTRSRRSPSASGDRRARPSTPPAAVGIDSAAGGVVAKTDKNRTSSIPKKVYERELLRLQEELVKMEDWVQAQGMRVVIVFEGRDAAGKGGAIKRITEFLNPRVTRIAALPKPTERERTQWYFQRYVAQMPAAGEIVLFDRSWYNRAGVEKVMGFCTPGEHRRFLQQCPIFERLLVEDGILLRKYWFSVSDEEQQRRFRARLKDPMRQWKLSPMDLESIARWEDYSRAKDEMFVHTDTSGAPWYVEIGRASCRERV